MNSPLQATCNSASPQRHFSQQETMPNQRDIFFVACLEPRRKGSCIHVVTLSKYLKELSKMSIPSLQKTIHALPRFVFSLTAPLTAWPSTNNRYNWPSDHPAIRPAHAPCQRRSSMELPSQPWWHPKRGWYLFRGCTACRFFPMASQWSSDGKRVSRFLKFRAGLNPWITWDGFLGDVCNHLNFNPNRPPAGAPCHPTSRDACRSLDSAVTSQHIVTEIRCK